MLHTEFSSDDEFTDFNYVLNHYEIDTLKITKIRHPKITVLILKFTCPHNGFQQSWAQTLSRGSGGGGFYKSLYGTCRFSGYHFSA